MKHTFTLILALLAFAAVAPAQQALYNYDESTNFSNFHTYKWVTIQGAELPNALLYSQIQNAINSQLASKGLTVVTGDKADLFIGIQIATQKNREYNTFNMGGPWFGGMQQTTSSTIVTGQLVLDMYDAANKKMVWRGNVSETINPSGNPEKNQQNLNKAIGKLLANYPPGAAKQKKGW
jgi:hypothetical protein